MLSPTQGQVAHALLTRPPLIRDRSPVTVRLECVMHAASVHPEPGSNSQTNCISSAVAVRFLSELFILAFFTFLELCSLWFWQILYSHLLFCFVLLSSVVQLSSFNRAPFCERLSIISLSFRFVKYFFKISLNFFWPAFECFLELLFAATRLLYHKCFALSIGFLKFFWKFFEAFFLSTPLPYI